MPGTKMARLLTDLLADLTAALARLGPFDGYVDPDALLVLAAPGRRTRHGLRACLHCTRFRETRSAVAPDGRHRLPEVSVNGRPIRYVVTFTLPRFLWLSPWEQAADVVHELLHIDPSFDGSPSSLRHGPAFERAVRGIVEEARAAGFEPPALPGPGESVFYLRARRSLRALPWKPGTPPPRWDERRLQVAYMKVPPPPGRDVREEARLSATERRAGGGG